MAALTWRNVDSPDFRPAMEGYAQFSQLLGNAFSGLQGSLKDFDRVQSDEVNRAFALELAKFNDPAALEAALAANPTLGADANRLSIESINSARSRVGTLLDQDGKELQLQDTRGDMEWEGKTRGRTEKDWAATDAAQPVISQIISARLAGNDALAEQLHRENAGVLGALGADQQFDVATKGQSVTRGDVGLDQDRLGLKRGNWEFDTTKLSYEEGRIANALQLRIGAQVADSNDVEAYFSDNAEELVKQHGANAVLAAKNALLGSVPRGSAPIVTAGGLLQDAAGDRAVGSVSIDQDRETIAGEFKTAGLPTPVIAGLLGNFEVEGGYKGAQGDGGTASGIAQWRKDRRANFKQMFGKDPHQASKADQAKFVVWELNNPEKAGLNPAGIAKIKAAKTPAEAARLIDQYYEISDGKHRDRRVAAANGFAKSALLGAQSTAVSTQIAKNNSGDPARDLAKYFMKGWSDDTPAIDIAKSLTGKGASFEGEDHRALSKRVDSVMREYGVNGNVAGAIIRRSASGAKNKWNDDWGLSRFLTWDGLKTGINDEMVEQLGNQYKGNRGLQESVLANEAEQGAITQIGQARQVLAAAEQALAQRQALARQTGKPLDMSRYRQAVLMARANLEAINSGGARIAVAGQR